MLEMVKNGIEKDELLEKTSHTVGVNNVSFDVEEGETFVIMAFGEREIHAGPLHQQAY